MRLGTIQAHTQNLYYKLICINGYGGARRGT
jgi:hypothetical protein